MTTKDSEIKLWWDSKTLEAISMRTPGKEITTIIILEENSKGREKT